MVAVSGGPDSVALLHLLSGLAPDLGLSLEVAHFDHRVRPGSEKDAGMARALAAELGLPFHLGGPTEPPRVRQASLRDARYQWLAGVVRERHADRLAVGHQADDQVETVLFRLMRGTDLRGLAGIPERRGSIVRPLLPFRRADLSTYLEGRGASWIDDPSNQDRQWARARLRNEVIPDLERLYPGTIGSLLAFGQAAARARDLVERLADQVLMDSTVGPARADRVTLSRRRLARGGSEIVAVAIRRVARSHDVALTAGGTRIGVEFISEGRSGGRVDIGGGLEITREFDRVTIGRGSEPARPEALLVRRRKGAGRLRIGDRALDVRWRPISGEPPLQERIAVAVSPGHYPLMFRGWRHGDRIRLPGGSRKLKKLFGDRRIPASQRACLPVLADRLGNVLWIEGVATAESTGSEFLEFELSHE